MTAVEIRDASGADISSIKDLMIELIVAIEKKPEIKQEQITMNLQRLLENEYSYLLVAEKEGAIIGMIHFNLRKTILHSLSSALIDEIIVTKNYRAKGIGRQLIKTAVEKCKQLGCSEIEVSTEKTNSDAREFYRNCGFSEKAILLEMDL